MALGYIFHHESVLGKQFFRKPRDFLSVLQRTGRVIGDHEFAGLLRRQQGDVGDILGDILCQRRYLRRRRGEVAVFAQHESVVLDHRPATRCRHQDGVEAALAGLLEPDRDVGARARQRVVIASEVMGQCAAAPFVPDQHDLDAVTRQKVDGGLIDARRQHLLGAALQQRDPPAPFPTSGKNASAGGSRRRQAAGRKSQHRLDST